MDLGIGDMRFLNNAVVLHRRTAYQDRLDAPRDLIRLWLATG